MKEKQGWVSVDDRLPEYEREVVVLVSTGMDELGEFKVAYGHRPNPNGYIITKTGEHLYAELYDEGGWNGPGIKYWLDLPMPNEQCDDTKMQLIDKACEWLYSRQAIDLEVPNIDEFILDFRKAMEDEQ